VIIVGVLRAVVCCVLLFIKQSIDLHSAEISMLKNRERELLRKVDEHFCFIKLPYFAPLNLCGLI